MIDLRKHTSFLNNKISNSNKSGAVLIWLIITMVAMGGIGTSMVYLTTTSTYDVLFANNQTRAYYIAESGGNYAIPQIRDDPATFETFLANNGNTFTLSNGGKFTLSVDTSNSDYTLLESTGIVSEGDWFQAVKLITYKVFNLFFDEPFDTNTFSSNWNTVGGIDFPQIHSGGTADGDPALRLKDMDGDRTMSVSLNWYGNPNLPNLADSRDQNSGLLSYTIQAKIKMDSQGNRGDYYMVGLSFRLDTVKDDTYGISFFKAQDTDGSTAPWVTTFQNDDDPNGTGFTSIMDGDVYLVLWEKVDDIYTLLANKNLTLSANPDDIIDANGLRDWSTIVVDIKETNGGSPTNSIMGYYAGPDDYARNTLASPNPISWNLTDTNVFSPVVWDDRGVQTVIDNSLTTAAFDPLNPPEEIGIHIYYDSGANNDLFFDDFAINLGENNANTFIQY